MSANSSPARRENNPQLARTLAEYGSRWSAVAIATAEAMPDAGHLSSWDWFEMLDCIEVVLRPILPPRPRKRSQAKSLTKNRR